MVSILESSALTLRLLDNDDEDAVDSDSSAVVAREDIVLLETTAESQLFTIIFLWTGVIFNLWLVS